MEIESLMLKTEGCWKMISLKKLILLILCICLAIFTISCSTNDEIEPVVEVDLSTEKKVVEAFGLIKAEETKDIIIDFPALILDILVKEGQHVGENEPIMTLDLSEYKGEITNKKNELNIANLEYQQINKSLQGISLENNETDKNKLLNDIEFSNKILDQATIDYESKEKLYTAGAISKDELNQSKSSLDEAQNNADSLAYELKQVDNNLGQNNIKYSSEKDQLSIQGTRIEQIKVNLSLLEEKLNKPYITDNQIVSEFDNAVVYDISYKSGHIIDTSKKAFSISNLDSLVVEANVVEEFIGDVKLGATVRIVPIADRTREYEGKVQYISQMAFQNNGETVIPIRISIEKKDDFLMPNYNVDVYIDVE